MSCGLVQKLTDLKNKHDKVLTSHYYERSCQMYSLDIMTKQCRRRVHVGQNREKMCSVRVSDIGLAHQINKRLS